MKYTYLLCLAAAAALLSACGSKGTGAEEETQETKTSVSLVRPAWGHIPQTISFPSMTVYQKKSSAFAPVSGFVREIRVVPGSDVEAGACLAVLETRERHAVGGSGEEGVVRIPAVNGGIVMEVLCREGDYLPEGAALCTVADPQSLVFEVNVPFEKRSIVREGQQCTIILPDGTSFSSTVLRKLKDMNFVSQSERAVVSAEGRRLPSGLYAKAVFRTERAVEKNLILPRKALQSNEELSSYWVMKLSADSTAVKVPVQFVGSTPEEVEIVSESLSPEDEVVLIGGYGLEEGTKVVAVEEE